MCCFQCLPMQLRAMHVPSWPYSPSLPFCANVRDLPQCVPYKHKCCLCLFSCKLTWRKQGAICVQGSESDRDKGTAVHGGNRQAGWLAGRMRLKQHRCCKATCGNGGLVSHTRAGTCSKALYKAQRPDGVGRGRHLASGPSLCCHLPALPSRPSRRPCEHALRIRCCPQQLQELVRAVHQVLVRLRQCAQDLALGCGVGGPRRKGQSAGEASERRWQCGARQQPYTSLQPPSTAAH